MRIDFYFDYLSPYAYFGWRRLAALEGHSLALHPVVFAKLLEHHGHKGPAEIPSKRRFVIRDTLRLAARHGLPLSWPRPHPFRSLSALRASLPGPGQAEVVERLWTACWGEGRDLSDRAVLGSLLGEERLVAAESEDAKRRLREETEAAIAAGVFGVPTFIADGELIWGADRFEDLRLVLEGRDPLDRARAERAEAEPYGVKR